MNFRSSCLKYDYHDERSLKVGLDDDGCYVDTMPAFSYSPTHIFGDTQPTAFQHAGLPQHLVLVGLLSFSKFPQVCTLLFVIIDVSKYHREYNFKSVLVLPLPDP